jgi:hypothetical protein
MTTLTTVKIRFVTGNDWASDLVRIGQHDGWCTHVETILPDGSLLGAHLVGGVAIRPAGYDKYTMVRELTVPLDLADADAYYTFQHEQVGKMYDTTGITGLMLDRDWRQTDSWFCSELVAAGLEQCGFLPPLAAVANHITPRDLLLILSGRQLIEGAR